MGEGVARESSVPSDEEVAIAEVGADRLTQLYDEVEVVRYPRLKADAVRAEEPLLGRWQESAISL